MSNVENKALIHRYFEAQNTHDLEAIFAFLGANILAHNVPGTDQPVGGEAAKGYFVAMHNAMPDLHVTLHDSIAEADKVAVRFTVTGTPASEFMGLPAGQPVSWLIFTIYRLEDGKIAEVWST
jgi:steroid delta-isomerase-like uncharacterized protein